MNDIAKLSNQFYISKRFLLIFLIKKAEFA